MTRNWINYARGSVLEQDQYIERCIGALDDVMDWEDPNPDWVNDDGTFENQVGSSEADRRTHDLGQELGVRVAECITPRCTECGGTAEDMDEQERVMHRIYRGMVLVGCEGYWLIDPKALGIPDEVSGNWHNAHEGK